MLFMGSKLNRRPSDPRRVYRLWEKFNSAEFHEDLTDDPHEVSLVKAWARSRALGADPQRRVLPSLPEEAREGFLRGNRFLLSAARPAINAAQRSLSGFPGMLVLTDGGARVLQVAGAPDQVERAKEQETLVEGALFSEAVAGTNGIGTALFLKGTVQVRSAEHFCEVLRGWTCAAAPIPDPFSDGTLGLIDLTFPSALDAVCLSIAESLAARIAGEVRLQLALERLRIANIQGEYSARYPADQVLAYDRLGHPIPTSEGACGHGGDKLPADDSSTRLVEAVPGGENGEPIGTIVVVRRREVLRYSIPGL